MQVVTNGTQIAKLCKLAALAYQGAKTVIHKLEEEYLEGWPDEWVDFFQDGFIVTIESQVIIVLKGIGNLEEYASKRKLFDDNALIPAPLGIPGRTHKGLTGVAQMLSQDLTSHIYSYQSVTVVGHSLGGGIGVLLGAFFANKGWNVQIYTFGSPKVGNQQFVSWLEQHVKCCSTNIEGDPIPSWPILPEYEATTCVHTLKEFRARQFIKMPNGIEDISEAELQAHCIFAYLLATSQAAKHSS